MYMINNNWHKCFKNLKVTSPDNNPVTDPEPFNLMFKLDIGPLGNQVGYLRPETAQGMFVNFSKLLAFNGGKIPFGAAQVGLGFRNEISPRNQLFRLREFDMAEIEYFFDPQFTDHPKYKFIKARELPLLSSPRQEEEKLETPVTVKIEDAVSKGMICNQTMAYFMVRTFDFLIKVGINKDNIRFRQHRKKEMAHYACDCWDAEIETSLGWVESVGIANRSAFDLKQHSQATGKELVAARPLKVPKEITIINIEYDRKTIGMTFKKDQQIITKYLSQMDEQEKTELVAHFEKNDEKIFTIEGQQFKILKSMILKTTKETKIVQEEKYIPWVIEPAFGIGRIIQATLEHNFKMRDEKRTYICLPPKISPIKCSILPVVSVPQLIDFAQQIKSLLTKARISSKVDDSGTSIGKRYARTDELGSFWHYS
eukprot:TRINITY_DN3647_c0_g3_i1.p2 TRINITY_DN3647_c0_g3~~TRINITY_DN3647_c0_g3_i1.p2  ORF type:complete len:426 (-),score=80.65 TRINITY_DN3647_c0_g3_i1:344-1621(-)